MPRKNKQVSVTFTEAELEVINQCGASMSDSAKIRHLVALGVERYNRHLPLEGEVIQHGGKREGAGRKSK